ncbi:MAG: hypothetical protein AAF483_04200 [Planctomycetota bacterium]
MFILHSIFIGFYCNLPAFCQAKDPSSPANPIRDRVDIRDSIARSIPYLEKDGQAWMIGEAEYQDRACVSCHQVPSGAWSLAVSYRAIDWPEQNPGTSLLGDAIEFVSDPKVGRPASWAQLAIAAQSYSESDDGAKSRVAMEKFLPEILKAQQEDGRWRAQGQFPSQRRSIDESDAVITLWMQQALQGESSKEVQAAIKKAQDYVAKTKGDSIEFLAWQLLLEEDSSKKQELATRVMAAQSDNGSFGWSKDGKPTIYATGVALYALSQSAYKLEDAKDVSASQNKAIAYLLREQGPEGYWKDVSENITKRSDESHEYIYQYWSSAWATLGLASAYSTMDR